MNVCSTLVALAALAGATGCQHDIRSDFPPGLAPLEDDTVPDQTTGPYAETLTTATDDTDYVHVYGRGFIQAAPAAVWPLIQNAEIVVATCTTTSQTITPEDQAAYEYSFLVDYVVNEVLTVEWTDEWRFGTIEGTPDDPTLAMVKHQKTDGSSFIRLSEGTIQLSPTDDDPDVTDIAFVEHLNSVGGSDSDVLKGVQHTFDALVAVAHGNPIPGCP